jgi:branched-chain amino acid transport system substrate-binding protein
MESRMSRFIGQAAVLAAVAAIAWGACARRVPGGDLGGSGEPTQPAFEPKQSSEADEALKGAIAVAESGNKKKAVDAYLAVRRTHPETTAGQEALYRAGVLYFEQGAWADARKALNELVFENPLYDKANDARLKAGLAALEMGAYRDAYQTLSALAQRVQGPEREQALRAAERAASAGQLFNEALRVALRRVDAAASPEQRDAALEEVTRLVEGQVPFVEIARQQQELSPSHPAWPILTFKLARIYYHLRDWTRLNETLEVFLRETPQHPFAAEARGLQERSQRRSETRPRTVGVILPMTGKYKLLGEAVLRGIRLALDGSDIELVVKDSQGEMTLTGKAMEELVFDSGAIAVLGPLLVEDSRRAALIAEELQVPILTLTRAEAITQLGPWVFRNMLTNAAQAEALARYTTEVLGFKRFAILYPNKPYGVELTNAFWDELQRRGAQVRGVESYDHDQTTFTAEAKKLVGRYYLEDRHDYLEASGKIQGSGMNAFRKRKAMEKLRSSLKPIVDFEALFIPDDWRSVGLVAPALAVEDIITNACDPKDLERIRQTTGNKNLRTVTLVGTNQWSSPKGRSGIPELLERGGKFVTCSVYVDGFYVDSDRPATKRFVEAYRHAYPEQREPGLLEAIGYDSAGMLRKVAERARPTTRAEFRDRLASLKDFEGASGRTSFDDSREAVKPLFILNIENDGVREVQPQEKLSTGS